MRSNLNHFVSKGFNGTFTLEFVKEEDTMEAQYANTIKDFDYIKSILSK